MRLPSPKGPDHTGQYQKQKQQIPHITPLIGSLIVTTRSREKKPKKPTTDTPYSYQTAS